MVDATTATESRRGRSVPAGWLCLVVGLVLMFYSLATVLIYAPLFLAAFILSIVGMVQGRIFAGVVLLIATLAVPTISWFGLFSLRFNDALVQQEAARTQVEDEKRRALWNVRFEEVSGHIDGDYMYCEGKVRNSGNVNLEYVKVRVEWLDANDTVLDTDWTYAVSGEGLRPGGAKSFKVMTPVDRRMKRFRYEVVTD